MEISYRDGTRGDAPAIVEFQRAMARETEDLELDAATVTRGVHGVFDDPSRGRYFVAARGGDVVASLMITPEWSDWRNGWFWWVQSVYVRGAAQAASLRGALRARATPRPR